MGVQSSGRPYFTKVDSSMPIDATWIHEPTIRYHIYQGKITAPELEQFIVGALALLNTVNHELFYVVEFRQVESFPLNLMQISPALELIRHRNFGAIAFTGTPSVLNFWATVFNKVSNFKIVKANSVAHAQELLANMYGVGSGKERPTT